MLVAVCALWLISPVPEGHGTKGEDCRNMHDYLDLHVYLNCTHIHVPREVSFFTENG